MSRDHVIGKQSNIIGWQKSCTEFATDIFKAICTTTKFCKSNVLYADFFFSKVSANGAVSLKSIKQTKSQARQGSLRS